MTIRNQKIRAKIRIFTCAILVIVAGSQAFGQSKTEFELLYRGDRYKKARVVSASEVGVTVTTERGKLTLPLNALPFNIQREVQQQLAAEESKRLAQARAAAAAQVAQGKPPSNTTTSTTYAPSTSSEAAAASSLGTDAPQREQLSAMTPSILLDLVLGGAAALLAFLFLLSALLGNNRGRSLFFAAICIVGGAIPAKRGLARLLNWEEIPDDEIVWTVPSAQEEALKRYPDLATPGSKFNKAYVQRHEQYRRDNPAYFEQPDWPLRLAEEVASMR